MTFDDIRDQRILELLRRQGRVSYWALKRRFDLHDDIAGLKDELITVQRLAVDEDGKVLVWTGEAEEVPIISVEKPPTPIAG